MSHGGPLTLAQKRMMAMRSESATNAPTTDPQHMPLLPPVYDQSSSASTSPRNTDNQPSLTFGDIEMQDISAPATPSYSHSRPQPSFSAAAKPFVPPGGTDTTTETMPSASTTPMKRLPPHRAMQAQTPKNSAAIPIVKPEPPAASALTEHSAVEPPVRRTGPHAKLGPHARKVVTPVQPDGPSTIQAQDDKIDVQQTPDPDTWTSVQEPQVEMEAAQSEPSPIHYETEPEAAPSADKPATLDSAPSAEPQAPAVEPGVATSNQVNRVTSQIGPNKWLAMLEDLNDPEKGCEVILALADHLRSSVGSRKSTAGEFNTAKEMVVLMENVSGQRMPAKVASDMAVSDMIKECASYINVHQSDIQIVLKINQSEEL
ncbi:hypothetical protein KCU81_g7501, partial [Aureobasidium melanogenum]|uniref:Uncharacterized protein n=1 Tax=Aureobasidium melanogenum (strain CBS 110374) TaxID=1043003 RepID=A0A074VDW4_AURM1